MSSHEDLPNEMQRPIQDYGIVGDCRGAALVSKSGSIDWLCWPRFDSAPLFTALLDSSQGGRWTIHPPGEHRIERAYVPGTNVLSTRWHCPTGVGTLLDLMPAITEEEKAKALFPDHELIREVRCESGELELLVSFHPRADYGRSPLRIRHKPAFGFRIEAADGVYWLRTNSQLEIRDDCLAASLHLRKGDVVQFSLTFSEEAPAVLPLLGEPLSDRIESSVAWWKNWSGRCTYQGPYREAVLRSALALKLLAYAPSGAIAAAATTSLPEILGGDLNWDYRYCWLRDASLTVRAMLGLGYVEETESFLGWLLHATRMTQPELRIMYDVFGKVAPRERELTWLKGYRDSRPVRIGNDARNQLQLDIYGEVIDAAAQYGRNAGKFDRTTQSVLIGFGKYVTRNWDQPDEGIWEPRSGRQNHTHSRLMCWTALDRLLEMGHKGIIDSVPEQEFAVHRERIRKQIEERAWNSEMGTYVSALDGHRLDATLLRIPWYGFEKPDSERMIATSQQVHRELGAGNSLLYRYSRDPREGAFGICGFWGAEFLAIGGGTLSAAHDTFRQLLSYRNEIGLFSEEIDPETGVALGNFPQAFTHVGLISAALSLDERERSAPHPAAERESGPQSQRRSSQ